MAKVMELNYEAVEREVIITIHDDDIGVRIDGDWYVFNIPSGSDIVINDKTKSTSVEYVKRGD